MVGRWVEFLNVHDALKFFASEALGYFFSFCLSPTPFAEAV